MENQQLQKLLFNLFKPSSGEIFFDNVCVTKIKKNKEMMNFRKQIQMIFQDPLFFTQWKIKS